MKHFLTCQSIEKKKKKYNKIPPKNVELIPWDIVCIDLVGPYTVTEPKDNDRILNIIIIVDPATDWFETAKIFDKTSARISQIFNNTWLSRYPRFRTIILTIWMSLSMISYLPSRTLALRLLLEPSIFLKWIVYIKSEVICCKERTFRNMTLMIWTLGVSYWL